MDAAKVGDRKDRDARPALDPLKKETMWDSAYYEPDRWKRDMADCHYDLVGEYEIDDDTTLLRFELDEQFRHLYVPGTSHFQNVILHRSRASKGEVAKKQYQ